MKFCKRAMLSLLMAPVAFSSNGGPNEWSNIEASMDTRQQPVNPYLITNVPEKCNAHTLDVMMMIEKYHMNISDPVHVEALAEAVTGRLALGSHGQLIPEASDASRTGALVIDGLSGDTRFPAGSLKALITVGEVNMCYENLGEVYTGVPDGMGAYMPDDETVRIVVQSESYGPVARYETWEYPVNGAKATFTGSHIHYIDYDREKFSKFMTHMGLASEMITGFGQVATKYYNLKGEPVGPRNPNGPTEYGAHYSNTDAAGNYVVTNDMSGGAKYPEYADWVMQSLCSAHLEEKHQWGEGIGFEDSIFLTNEEWMVYSSGNDFVGISMHAVNLAEKEDYAVGAVTNSGFEKIVEVNPMSKDYVVLAISGYNGAYSGYENELLGRNAEYGKRPDGMDYVWTRDICPTRIYVGLKGYLEDGTKASEDDFLARNGLKYGKVYGFAIDMSAEGPTGGLYRDEYHRQPDRYNGDKVEGKFVPIDWQWDGEVRNFRHDGSWEWQKPPPGFAPEDDFKWWNSNGLNASGSKTEHVSNDPRPGVSGFVQSSTAGYFGHYYLHGLKELFEGLEEGALPEEVDSSYYVYQGEVDITSQVVLGMSGLTSIEPEFCTMDNMTVVDATLHCDRSGTKNTFEDVDGFEVIAAKEGLYAIIQEDSGNVLGERMFITKLEHEADGMELEYHFIAQSGGSHNTRMKKGVGIPARTNMAPGGHEFSGVIDMSAFVLLAEDFEDSMDRRELAADNEADYAESGIRRNLQNCKGEWKCRFKTNGDCTCRCRCSSKCRRKCNCRGKGSCDDLEIEEELEMGSKWAVKAGDAVTSHMARMATPINDKLIAVGLQSHNFYGGAVTAFRADRGGQILLYKPSL